MRRMHRRVSRFTVCRDPTGARREGEPLRVVTSRGWPSCAIQSRACPGSSLRRPAGPITAPVGAHLAAYDPSEVAGLGCRPPQPRRVLAPAPTSATQGASANSWDCYLGRAPRGQRKAAEGRHDIARGVRGREQDRSKSGPWRCRGSLGCDRIGGDVVGQCPGRTLRMCTESSLDMHSGHALHPPGHLAR